MSSEAQVQVTQEDIRVIRHDVAKLSTTLDKVHIALVGSELGKDGGIVERLTIAEKEVERIYKKIEVIEDERKTERAKSSVYKSIALFLMGTTVAAIIGALVKHLST